MVSLGTPKVSSPITVLFGAKNLKVVFAYDKLLSKKRSVSS